MASLPDDEGFPSTPLVIAVVDLTGYAAAFRTHSDADMARFLDWYYGIAETVITGAGGRIIKFIGDSILAVFDPERASQAVAAAVTMETQVLKLATGHHIPVTLGANLHLGPVVEAEFGEGSSRRPDVVGRAVNQTFLLGRGSGIRISEPVYRKLPNEERTRWEKNEPPAVYVLGEGGEA